MAVRDFNGSTDRLNTATGAASGMTFGTFAVLFRRTETANVGILTGLHASGGAISGLILYDANSYGIAIDADEVRGAGSGAGHTNWQLVVIRKATGSAVARKSSYNFGTATWSHENASSALSNWTSPGAGGAIRFDYETSSFPIQGRVAVRAVWANSLPWSADTTGDAAIVAAGLHTALANWVSANPSVLHAFNQAAVTTDVEDLSTTGTADQTSRTGTTVITGDDPPGFNFGGGTAFTRDIDDDLDLTDSVAVDRGIVINDVLGLDDSVDVDSSGVFTRDVDDDLDLTDSVAVDRGIVINDVLDLDDSGQTFGSGETIDDDLGLSDTLAIDRELSLSDTLNLTDVVTVEASGATARIIDDTLGLTDAVIVETSYVRDIDDTLGLTDSINVDSAAGASRTVNDILGLTDSVTIEASYVRDIDDILGLSDDIVRAAVFIRDINDTLGLTDDVTVQVFTEINRIIDDTLGLTDDVTVVLNPAAPPDGPHTLVAVESGHTLVAVESGHTLVAVESGHTLVAVGQE